MKFTAALAVLVVTHCTSAFRVPEGAADGKYIAYINKEGVEVHEPVESFHDVPDVDAKIVEPAAAQSPAPNSLEDRKAGTVHCGCGFHLQGGYCDKATADLEHQLGNGADVKAGLAYYAIHGKVVAFACNPGPYNARVTSRDASDSFGTITGACGYYIAGTLDWGVRVGYMNNPGDFCAAANGSNKHHC